VLEVVHGCDIVVVRLKLHIRVDLSVNSDNHNSLIIILISTVYPHLNAPGGVNFFTSDKGETFHIILSISVWNCFGGHERGVGHLLEGGVDLPCSQSGVGKKNHQTLQKKRNF